MGTSPITVAQMLGHSSTGIVMTYAKAIDEARRDAIRNLEEFRGSHGGDRVAAKDGELVQ